MRNIKKEINKKDKNKAKDTSTKDDYFLNCRFCKSIITSDYRSSLDKRYCADCLT
jgi:hypothetical protein|tara:strand:- start:307 stop:471 length:165 start_codon:yes stop_codon:yes gene_type:complete